MQRGQMNPSGLASSWYRCKTIDTQGRINHGAKRAMAQGPPPLGGPPRHQEFF